MTSIIKSLVKGGSNRPPPTIALINSSDDTVDIVERMLTTVNMQVLTTCHFADLKKGNIDFAQYLAKNKPAVVIFDISPPYKENWEFFKTIRDSKSMTGRGLVVTTTNKLRLDEIIGSDSNTIEIVGKPYDLQQIADAIAAALATGEEGIQPV